MVRALSKEERKGRLSSCQKHKLYAAPTACGRPTETGNPLLMRQNFIILETLQLKMQETLEEEGTVRQGKC